MGEGDGSGGGGRDWGYDVGQYILKENPALPCSLNREIREEEYIYLPQKSLGKEAPIERASAIKA